MGHTNGLAELGAADLRAVLDIAAAAAEAPSYLAAAEVAASGVRRLVGGDIGSFNVVDPAGGRAVLVVDPSEAWDRNPDADVQLALHGHEHPQIATWAAHDPVATTTISDFLPTAGFHRLALYQGVFRPIDVEDVLTQPLAPRTAGVLTAVSVLRGGRTFSPRDRGVVGALRPHLRSAVAAAVGRATTRALLEAPAGQPVMVVGPDGAVLAANGPCRSAAERGLGLALAPGRPLPAGLRWLADHRLTRGERRRVALRHGDRTLTADVGGDSGQEVAVVTLPSDGPVADPADLALLGLSPRQAEVLAMVAQGATNQQVAHALGISPGTVRKHLEAVYARLGVTNRTSAAALALGIKR